VDPALAIVTVPVMDRKAGFGTAEMETIAEARSLSLLEEDTVAVASVDSQCCLEVVEIDARSIPFLNLKNTRVRPARLRIPLTYLTKRKMKTVVKNSIERITLVC